MANTRSAKKRIRINKRNRSQNLYYKTSVRNLIKIYFKELEVCKMARSEKSSNKTDLKNLVNSIYSLLDKGVKKNVFHKNKAAKQKSKLMTCLKRA